MKKKKKYPLFAWVLIWILTILAIGAILAGLYFLYLKNRPAYQRQAQERELADTYIDDMIRKLTAPESNEATTAEASGETGETEKAGDTGETDHLDYADENYYMRDGVVYTPEYARGVIDCVLEVPTAGIRRGVYTGTWDDIYYDLDIWMVTAARPDYVLGETHYCIYGHNHTIQDLSFNRLKDVAEGDMFYLTAESGHYTYEVTRVFAVERDAATAEYVNNFALPSDKCYIITCGRDDGVNNYRYLDLVVEGTLKRKISLEEYAGERE